MSNFLFPMVKRPSTGATEKLLAFAALEKFVILRSPTRKRGLGLPSLTRRAPQANGLCMKS